MVATEFIFIFRSLQKHCLPLHLLSNASNVIVTNLVQQENDPNKTTGTTKDFIRGKNRRIFKLVKSIQLNRRLKEEDGKASEKYGDVSGLMQLLH